MAIYTPRGLKVRVSVPYAFALMARLAPRVSPFRVLKTTEGLECLPGMLAFIAGMLTFGMRLPPLHIGLAVGGAQLFGVLLTWLGLFLIPGLVFLGTIFSYLAGYGILLAAVAAFGFASVGWRGVLAYFVARLAAGFASMIFGFWQTGRNKKLAGQALTTSEVNFLNAYRLHASRLGITTDIDLNDGETQEGHWLPTFVAFAAEWPQVAQRFTAGQ